MLAKDGSGRGGSRVDVLTDKQGRGHEVLIPPDVFISGMLPDGTTHSEDRCSFL